MRKKIIYHPFYNALLKNNNINRYEIRSLDALKKLPFTTKKGIVPSEKKT